MRIEIGVFGGVGMVFPHLPMFAMAGLGMAMAVSSLLKRIDYDSGIPDTYVEGDCDISASEVDIHDNVDEARIDQLPDDIILNVVSRLTTFEASHTSILSRRWRHIWTMSPNIKLSCLDSYKFGYNPHRYHNDKLWFLKAVDECLKLYSGRKLKSFTLECCFLIDYTSHLERWMQSVSYLDVERLYIGNPCVTIGPQFTFSLRLIYGWSTLKYLRLGYCDLKPSLSGQFKSLETVNLQGVRLFGDDMSGLLLSCPNLKFLYMVECMFASKLRICGPNLKLNILRLYCCTGLCGLDISAVNLVNLEIYSCSRVELLLSSVPKLEYLCVRFDGKDTLSYCFGDVKRDLPQLECLLVQTETDQMQWIPPTFKMFSKIRTLYLLMTLEFKVDLRSFTTILSLCPLLETFYLSAESPVSSKGSRVQWPTLQHKHLKHMELAGFDKTQNEFEFAKFILRSTEILQWLILRTSFRQYRGEGSFIFIDERGRGRRRRDLHPAKNEKEAQRTCRLLLGYALSIHARVKMC